MIVIKICRNRTFQRIVRQVDIINKNVSIGNVAGKIIAAVIQVNLISYSPKFSRCFSTNKVMTKVKNFQRMKVADLSGYMTNEIVMIEI